MRERERYVCALIEIDNRPAIYFFFLENLLPLVLVVTEGEKTCTPYIMGLYAKDLGGF